MATLVLSGSAVVKAGTGVGAVPDTAWDEWIEEAEGFLCGLTKFDLVTNWVASLSGSSVAPMLSEYCSRQAAVEGINYDKSGYGTDEDSARISAEDLMNVHLFRMTEIIGLLKDASVQDFIGV